MYIKKDDDDDGGYDIESEDEHAQLPHRYAAPLH